MRVMLQYDHSKANIYIEIDRFQDEAAQFLNKLLEFPVC